MMNTPFREALLIDDDPTAHLIHAQLLKKLSVAEQVNRVGNGLQALDFIRRHWTAPGRGNRLVVVDLHMPVMDGFEFLVHFYAMHLSEEITTVVLTSSTNELDVRRAKLFPLLAYIEKPLTKKKIENMLDQYFRIVTDPQAR